MSSVRRCALRAGLAGMALSVAMLGNAGSALANSGADVYAGGIQRGHVFFNSYNDTFHLSDTSCDGHSVYIRWDAGSGVQRWEWSGGCNTEGVLPLNLPKGLAIDYVVCVNIQAYPDACSDIVFDTT